MLLSMTGFGKATAENRNRKFTVEIKSLNSKQLDLVSRIPSAYREIEADVRNTIASSLQRGKVEVSVNVENLSKESDVTINFNRVAFYKSQIEQMAEQLNLPTPADWYSVLMRCPEVFHTDSSSEMCDDDRAAISQALEGAINSLTEFRAQEGRKLEEFFKLRIERIRELLAQVPQYETQRTEKIRSRIEEQLKQIPKADYDRGRFEQEMIFYIEKLDISEEKQRLAQHLDYFFETLAAEPGQGKKLGFISQEMGREINTLGSKSNQADMQILVVKMKDELEQIKEQVLNAL